jgi:Neuraminyllactose-binding hemagglutinin precursor (NLBH)
MHDRRLLSALTILATVLAPTLTVGCATAPPPVATYTPRFSFPYPAGAAPASDVTIAIVRPVDVTGLTNADNLSAKNAVAFNAAMAAQFQELFNRKGFRQTGPFDDLNSMTFPDKKTADLTLTPQVGITITAPFVNVHQQDDMFGTRPGTIYQATGPCVASGFVSFVLLEPLSGEKIWVKKVDVPQTAVDCSGERPDGLNDIIRNGAAYALEQVYAAVMKKAWDYLSPEEVTLLKKQSQELRAKKVY